MKILYVTKEIKFNWSNILERQYKILKKFNTDGKTILYKVKTENLKSYLANIFKLTKNIIYNQPNIIFIHHIINSYPVLAACFIAKSSRKIKNIKIVLALHEGEILKSNILPEKKIKEIRRSYSLNKKLRFLKTWHKLPSCLVNELLVLCDWQANSLRLKKYNQLNYLGIDTNLFYPISYYKYEKIKKMIGKNGTKIIFFPHNPNRMDKGYSILKNATNNLSVQIITSGENSYEKMNLFYNIADICVIPSLLYETYSLTLIEAMACDKLIVASNQLGLIKTLLKKYSVKELQNYGIYVVTPEGENLKKGITSSIQRNFPSRTLELFHQEKLDIENATKRLFIFLRKV